jgi:hypothetical protein
MLLNAFISILSFLLFTPPALSSLPSAHLIHQFPNPSWLESLSVRPNGLLLVTERSAPNLWQLNPFLPLSQTLTLIYSFPGYLGLLGIIETEEDVFAVVSGNFSLEKVKSELGSYAVWRVDLSWQEGRVEVEKNQRRARSFVFEWDGFSASAWE